MGQHFVLLGFILQVLWWVSSEAQSWSVSMPSQMTILAKSCVDIPCTFTKPYSHRPSDIAWYSYSSTGYPLVYRWESQSIIEEFRGKTHFTGDRFSGKCGLRITDVSPAMDQYSIYPWIDPETVKHPFYKTNVKLNVRVTAPPVELTIEGNPIIGATLHISCSVVHTCPSSPPILTFGGISGEVQNSESSLGQGNWQTQSIITFTARANDQGREVSCWVRHPGKQVAPSWIDINLNYAPRSVHVSAESSTAVAGGRVTLECRSDANPPASSFLWYLQRYGSVNTLTSREQSITVTDLLPGQNRFYCAAQSPLGVTNSSSPFIISAEYQPSILPESSCVFHGQDLWCWCKVQSLPSASMQWRVEGTYAHYALNNQEEFNVLQNHTLRGKLRLNKLVLLIRVTCKAFNAHGQQEHTLIIRASPQNVSINLEPPRVLEGQTLTLSCSSHAFPAVLSYSWFQIEEDREVQLSETSERIQLQVMGRHMGPFRCSAFNEIGEGISANTTVHVDFAPIISPNSSCTLINELVSCECVVESYPVATMTWTALGVERNQTLSTESLGTLRSTLTGRLRRGEHQLVICHATNEHGKISLQLELKGSSSSLIAVGCGVSVGALFIAGVLSWVWRRRRNNSQDHPVEEVELDSNKQR